MGRPSNNQRDAAPDVTTQSQPPAGAPDAATSDDTAANVPKVVESSAGAVQPADSAGAAATAPATSSADDDAGTSGDDDSDDGDDGDALPPPPPVKRSRAVVEATVAKGRTVQDVDGFNRRPGQTVRVPAADHGRLIELGFLAKPERAIVVPAKKGPSITRGS